MVTKSNKWKAKDLTDWAAENEIYLGSGCLDARDIEFDLPETVQRCFACGGNGKYVQRYCDAGRMTGRCDSCGGMGFQYRMTCRGVPKSVVNQIAVANDLEVIGHEMYGMDWRQA